jgi:PAS domain-containing protein
MLSHWPKMWDTMTNPLQGVDLWLVDSLVVPASLHDVEGRFVRINAAAERAIGSSNAHWLGRHFTEPVPPEARENVEAQFRRAVETGEPNTYLSDAATRSWAFSFSRSTYASRRPSASTSSCIRD